MNFLNPLVLFGLGAAVLPLVIHLLSRRRIKKVAFPSIEFLEKMKTDRMRRLKIKQLIVLLLRTLIIICLVLAFARPTVDSVFLGNSGTTAVIVLDNSASMQYVHNGEKLFDTAKRKAMEILDMLGSGTSVSIILTGDNTDVIDGGDAAGKDSLTELINDLEPKWGSGDPSTGFSKALALTKASVDPNREIYYITDNAENTLPGTLPEGMTDVRLYIVLIGPEERDGGVIDSITLVEKLLSPGKPVTFEVSGTAGSNDESMTIDFFVNGERKGRNVDAAVNGNILETGFSYTPESPGSYSVYAAVEDDRFEPGQSRRIVMNVSVKPRILLIADSPGDMYFTERALDPDPEMSMFEFSKVLSRDLAPANFADTDIVILNGISELSDTAYNSLLTSVIEKGVGVVVLPPMNSMTPFYTEGIFRDMFPATIERMVTVDGGGEGSFAVIDRFDVNHPILEGISDAGEFLRPEVRSYVQMRPTGNVRIIARFNDGYMAIGDTFCGKGRVVVFAVPPGSANSELPLSGIYVPLLIRTVQYLTGSEITGSRYETGDRLNESLDRISDEVQASLKPEGNSGRVVEMVPSMGEMFIKGEIAEKPGFYSLYAGGAEQSRFSVDTPVSEILFKRAGNSQLAEAYKGLDWKPINGEADIVETVMKDRYGTELFVFFLAIASILMILEMIVSKKL